MFIINLLLLIIRPLTSQQRSVDVECAACAREVAVETATPLNGPLPADRRRSAAWRRSARRRTWPPEVGRQAATASVSRHCRRRRRWGRRTASHSRGRYARPAGSVRRRCSVATSSRCGHRPRTPFRSRPPSRRSCDQRETCCGASNASAYIGGGAYEARRLVLPQNLGPGMERASPEFLPLNAVRHLLWPSA